MTTRPNQKIKNFLPFFFKREGEVRTLKEKSFEKKALRYWWDFVKAKKRTYIIGILTVVLTNAMQVLSTRNMGWIIDFFTGATLPAWLSQGTQTQQFILLFSILVGTALLIAVGRVGWRLTLARQTHEASATLKAELWDHVRFFKRRDLEQNYTKGFLMNASTSDVRSSRTIFGFTLVAVFDILFLGALTIVAMCTIHLGLSLFTLLALTGIPIFVRRLSEIEISRHAKAQEFLGRFNDLASQVISTVRLQRLSQTGNFWRRRLLDSAEEYRQRRLLSAFTGLRYIPLMGGSSVLTYIILFTFGVFLVFKGQLSVGDFVAMQGLIFLLQGPLMELGFIISEWRKGLTSLRRLNQVFDHPKESFLLNEPGRASFGDIDLAESVLSANELGFTYPGAPEAVFEGLSFDLFKGERLGIMGPIGSGKSTLLNIISGLEREGVKGEILFYERPFTSYTHEQLRSQIITVHQRPFLFSTSIKNNLMVESSLEKSLSEDEIWHYLEVAGLADDVKGLPLGIETPLGEWGLNLSGGQKQRLTLARALVRKPDLLLLDDCLSAVDTVTEEKILANLDNDLAETTLVWVAHRQSTLKYCDKLISMGDFSRGSK